MLGWLIYVENKILFHIILVAHSGLAAAYKCAAEVIVGSGQLLQAFDLDGADNPSYLYDRLLETMRALGPQASFLVLTDIYGGTPWQIASQIAGVPPWKDRAVVLSGMNLAMVLEACVSSARTESLDVLARRVLQAAVHDIHLLPEGIR
ncbi:MAG: PTS sugar transporter subunit IIA [Chloroflexi bacterium]|nr:PTS sugar transporter subunit IIA [Chloroflexota bacterium]